MARVDNKTTASLTPYSKEFTCRFYRNAGDDRGELHNCTMVVGQPFSPVVVKMLVAFKPDGYHEIRHGKAKLNWKDANGKSIENDVKYAKWAFTEKDSAALKKEALMYEEMRAKGDILGKITSDFYGYYEAKDKGTGKLTFAVSVLEYFQDSPEIRANLVERAEATKHIEQNMVKVTQALHNKGFIHRRLFYRVREHEGNVVVVTRLHLWYGHLLINERGDIRLISFESGKKHEAERQPIKQECPELVLMRLYRHSKNPADFLELVTNAQVDSYFNL